MRNGHTASEAVLEVLSQDPVWAAYAIADLRPDLARHCRWFVSGDASGLALLYFGLEPPILLTAGEPEGVAAALSTAELPPELFLSILPSHLPVVQRYYRHVSPQKMVRMALPQGKHIPWPAWPARRLSPSDANRLTALYRHGGDYAPDAFDPISSTTASSLASKTKTGFSPQPAAPTLRIVRQARPYRARIQVSPMARCR